MEENATKTNVLNEKELICLLRSENRASARIQDALKSISRAERLLNKLRVHGDAKDIRDHLATLDMSLYIEELASVLVEHCPRADEDRKWYNSYILICSDLIAQYGQRFLSQFISQIHKNEKKAPIFIVCLVTLTLGNVFDFSKDIRTLLTRLLDKASNIHSYVQHRRNMKTPSHLSDTSVMRWEENRNFRFIEKLYEDYADDLFHVTSATETTNIVQVIDKLSEGMVDLISVGLISAQYKKTLLSMIVKYVKQRSIVTLLILYEVYHLQADELQATRLRGINDLEIRQKTFGRYIQGIEQSILHLLNELVLKNQDQQMSLEEISPDLGSASNTRELKSLHKLTSTQSAPSLPVGSDPATGPDMSDEVVEIIQHDWSYPITRKVLNSHHLVVAVGMLHLKESRHLPADTNITLTRGELVLQSLVPRLFIDDFPLIFPKLYDVFLEFKASKVGLFRMSNALCSSEDDGEDIGAPELPVDRQVKWKDEIERYFYETLPDFRYSLPTLNDIRGSQDAIETSLHDGSSLQETTLEAQTFVDEPTPVAGGHFDKFLAEVLKYARDCAFIESGTAYCIDEFARTYFLKLFDSRNNRRRIAKLFSTGLHDSNAIPCAVRFAAIIDINTASSSANVTLPQMSGQTTLLQPGPILKVLAAHARAQFDKELGNLSQTRLDAKVYWAVYLGELCKFKALPVADILDILVELTQFEVFSRNASAPEIVCTLLEHVGRYLAGTYGVDMRLSNILTIIERMRARFRSIPPRVEVCLDDIIQLLQACCLRMRGEITPMWQRLTQIGATLCSTASPQIRYARHLISDIAARGLWIKTDSDMALDHSVDRYLKLKKSDSQPIQCATPPLRCSPDKIERISFEELVRRIKTLDLRSGRVIAALLDECLDQNNYSPNSAHMVHFLAELANEMPHFVGCCVDELIYRVVYCIGGKQQRLLEARMVSKFLNYKLIDTTGGLDIVAYLIGLAPAPHGASHFRTIFDCLLHISGSSKHEFPFELVRGLVAHTGDSVTAQQDVTYCREVQEEFEEVKIVEARSRLTTPLAQLIFARKANHHLRSAGITDDDEFFRYKMAIAILRDCGQSIIQRVYRSRLTFMIDILYYCLSYALQESISQPASPSNAQQLNLKLDFDEMSNHLSYPYTDLWDLPLACNNLAHFLKQIVREIEENEIDFQPLLGSEHSLLRGFKLSWARSLASESVDHSIDSESGARAETTRRLPSSSSSANLSDEECRAVDDSLFDKELNMLVTESLDLAKATAPRPGIVRDLRLPAKLLLRSGASQPFRLVTRARGGSKQVFRPINVPIDPSKACDHSDSVLDRQALDRQALKRFVLERALSEDTTLLDTTSARLRHHRPSEASLLTRLMLGQARANNEHEKPLIMSHRTGHSGKRCKRNKPARLRSRTTANFLTTDSSDD